MDLISRDELKERLDRGDDFKLVMALSEWEFRAKHIPGSVNVNNRDATEQQLGEHEDIVVYCADETCVASKVAYKMMKEHGYTNVRRYAGGIADWEEAGYPLEGEMTSARRESA